jgi:hypothetical protein
VRHVGHLPKFREFVLKILSDKETAARFSMTFFAFFKNNQVLSIKLKLLY